jgi:hypothetical protein
MAITVCPSTNSEFMTVVITACSSRKRNEVPQRLRASELPKGSIENLAREWLKRMSGARQVIPVTQLYAGRSFRLAQDTAEALDGHLHFVSAGLGVLGEDASIPAYDLTVAPASSQNVLSRAHERDNVGAGEWWDALTRLSPFGSSLRQVVKTTAPSLVLIALPSTYQAMVASDLARISDKNLNRLRIFCGSSTFGFPTRLQPFVMPYDNRLDGPDSLISGTKSDFAARAMWHFATTILKKSPDVPANKHAKAVEKVLADWRKPKIPKRARHTDGELLKLIRKHLKSAGGSSHLLHILRHDLGIACEQGRFSRLVAATKSGS